MLWRRAYIEVRGKDDPAVRCYVRRVRCAADGALYVKVGRRFIFFDDPPVDCRYWHPLNFTFASPVTRREDR
jgi:hypothetical protein